MFSLFRFQNTIILSLKILKCGFNSLENVYEPANKSNLTQNDSIKLCHLTIAIVVVVANV